MLQLLQKHRVIKFNRLKKPASSSSCSRWQFKQFRKVFSTNSQNQFFETPSADLGKRKPVIFSVASRRGFEQKQQRRDCFDSIFSQILKNGDKCYQGDADFNSVVAAIVLAGFMHVHQQQWRWRHWWSKATVVNYNILKRKIIIFRSFLRIPGDWMHY